MSPGRMPIDTNGSEKRPGRGYGEGQKVVVLMLDWLLFAAGIPALMVVLSGYRDSSFGLSRFSHGSVNTVAALILGVAGCAFATWAIPLYLGVAIWRGSFSALGLVVAFLIVLVAYLKLVEEKELEARFGKEYVEYRKSTPFLVPRVRGKDRSMD